MVVESKYYSVRVHRDDDDQFIAEAVGPMEVDDGVGCRGVIAGALGRTEQEARANLRRELERPQAASAR